MGAPWMAKQLGDLRARWRAALAFHVLIQLLGLAILLPLATALAHWLVGRSGDAVVTNFDLVGFALSPAGVGFILLVAAVTLGLLLAELAGHSWIAGHALVRRPTTVYATVAAVLARLPRLLGLALLVFLRLAALALPFLAVVAVYWFAVLDGRDVNYYLAEQPPEWRRGLALAALAGLGWALLAAWRLARWLYAVPILVFEGASPLEALEQSTGLTRGRLRRIVPPLLAWALLVTGLALAITWVGRQVSDAGLDWAGLAPTRVLPLVSVYLAVSILGGLLYGALQVAGHQFLVVRLYAEQRDPERLRVAALEDDMGPRRRRVARVAVVATLGLFALATALAWFLASRLDLREDVAITAHRGATAAAPENSMAAFRAAMEAGATYAELDVQRTRDGAVVVVHDGDLLRLAGDPRKVGAMTAAEIGALDIGARHRPPFPGEHPPTLEQVIDLVRGRMKLNVELKYNVPDPGLAAAVVEVLRRADFLDEAVITSLDYASLGQVRRLEPVLPTGHIVTASVGNVLKSEADFLSLNSAKASARLVRQAQRAGKQVHVWTVNDPEAMLRMIERGVDNIITDDPALLARVMRDRNALSAPEMLALRLRVLYAAPPRELVDPAAVDPL